VSERHYEVLGPRSESAPAPRPPGWLFRNRLVVLVLAVLAAVVGRELLSGESDERAVAGAGMNAVVQGVSIDPLDTFPRKVEIELTNTGARPVSATRLQLNGAGMGAGDVEEFNRELAPGEHGTVLFGISTPYCVTNPTARLDGVSFDAAGVASSVELTVQDPHGILAQVNDLSCFGGPDPIAAEVDTDRLASPPARPAPELAIPMLVRNDGELPVFIVAFVINDREAAQLAYAVPPDQTVTVQAPLSGLCQPVRRVKRLALLGEGFGGRPTQVELTLDDQVQDWLDRVVDRCPNPPVGTSAGKGSVPGL